jgi:hypothetical protein
MTTAQVELSLAGTDVLKQIRLKVPCYGFALSPNVALGASPISLRMLYLVEQGTNTLSLYLLAKELNFT